MIFTETISCISTVEPPYYVELLPNWATTVVYDLPAQPALPSPWEFGWEAVAALATAAAVIVALVVAFGSNKEALRRDRESRALASHQRWVEYIFQLGSTADSDRSSAAELIQNVKIATGDYAIHLHTQEAKLATSLRDHVRSIRRFYEIANQMLNATAAEVSEYDNVEKNAYQVFKDPKWARTYSNYVGKCASAVASSHSNLSTYEEARERLNTQDERLKEEFKDVFTLVDQRLALNDTLDRY